MGTVLAVGVVIALVAMAAATVSSLVLFARDALVDLALGARAPLRSLQRAWTGRPPARTLRGAAVLAATLVLAAGLSAVSGHWALGPAAAESGVTLGQRVPPALVDATLPLRDGLQGVCIRGKWGYMDERGVLVVAPVYRGAKPFSEGLGAVASDNRWGFVDVAGRVVVEPRYLTAAAFQGGSARVALEDYRVVSIDRAGRILALLEEAPDCYDVYDPRPRPSDDEHPMVFRYPR